MTTPKLSSRASAIHSDRQQTELVARWRRRRSLASKRGNSLPELMAVVAITGILAGIGTTSVRKHVGQTRTTEAVNMLSNMRQGILASNETIMSEGAGEILGVGQQARGFGGPMGGMGVLFKTDNPNANSNASKDKDKDKDEDEAEETVEEETTEKTNNGNGTSDDGGIDGDGNNGHGNNEDGCDPDNPGNSGDCDGDTDDSDDSDSGDDTSDDTSDADEKTNNGNGNGTNKDGGIDGDGNNGHGNNEDGCDPDNPGNSKDCDGDNTDDGGDDGGDTDDGGDDTDDDDDDDDGGYEDDFVGGNDYDGDRLCGSSTAVPSDFEMVRGKAYQPSNSEFTTGDSRNGWTCLRMAPPSGALHYQFGYDRGTSRVTASTAALPEGVDESSSFTGWARGDIDNDGRQSWFLLRGAVIDGQAYTAPTIEMIDKGE